MRGLPGSLKMKTFMDFTLIGLITFVKMVLAAPTAGNITGCLTISNSQGAICPYGHHFFCDNLPGVIAGL